MRWLRWLCVCVLVSSAAAFSASEHKQITDEAYKSMVLDYNDNTVIPTNDPKLPWYPFESLFTDPAAKKMSYGDLVALCGDFLGDYEVRVSASKKDAERHLDAVIKTMNEKADQVNRIIKHMAGLERQAALSGGFASEKLAIEHDKLVSLGAFYSSQASHKTEGIFNQVVAKFDPGWDLPKFLTNLLDALPFNLFLLIATTVLKSDFAALLLDNFDHFSNNEQFNTEKAYKNMHSLAIEYHRQGNLPKALLANAYADHFLTDRFAAGHITTPRLKLAEVCGYKNLRFVDGKMESIKQTLTSKTINIPVGDLLGSCQHDEDNHGGGRAKVESTFFEVKGDDHYFNPEMSEMRNRMIKALRISLREVLQKKTGDDALALQATPQVNTFIPFNSPLFKVNREGKLQMRFPFKDLTTDDYITMEKDDPVTDVLCWYAALKCRVLSKISGVNKLFEFIDDNIGNKPVNQLHDAIKRMLASSDFREYAEKVQKFFQKVIKFDTNKDRPIPVVTVEHSDLETEKLPAWAGNETKAALRDIDDLNRRNAEEQAHESSVKKEESSVKQEEPKFSSRGTSTPGPSAEPRTKEPIPQKPYLKPPQRPAQRSRLPPLSPSDNHFSARLIPRPSTGTK